MQIYKTYNKKADEFFVSFIDCNEKQKRYIFGHNQYTKSIIFELLKLNIKIDGIIDDFTYDRFYKIYDDYVIQILKIDDLKSLNKNEKIKIVVVVTSQSKTAISKMETLIKSSMLDITYIDYFAFQRSSRELSQKIGNNMKLLDLEFFDAFKREQNHKNVSTWADFRLDYAKNKQKYHKVFDSFVDLESKICFEKIINFRLNADYSFMKDFDFTPQKQYFEDFCNIKNIKYFFDIGAYKGETSIEFDRLCSNYEKIYFFEPDKNLFLIAQQMLNCKINKEKIQGFNIGLAGVDSVCNYCSDDTSGHITYSNTDNNSVIMLSKLDTLIAINEISINGGGGGRYLSNLILKVQKSKHCMA